MYRLTLVYLLLLISFLAKSQGTVLIISNENCEIIIDGEIKSQILRDVPKKIPLSAGEHFIQAISKKGKEKSDIITIDNNRQKIFKILFDDLIKEEEASFDEDNLITITDLDLTLLGEANALIEENIEEYSGISELHYAFEKGDKIIINGKIQNKKGKFFFEIQKYPENTLLYSKKGIKELKNQEIEISERSIYVIRIGTLALLDKKLKLNIRRKPASSLTKNFNTTVQKRTRFSPIQVLEPSHHYINSTSNETFKGGTNEIIIPITIPQEAIEWYYIISSSRNENEIDANLKNISLIGDLTKILNGINPTTAVINIGLDLITQPPGSDYCDVYLLDYDNQNYFSVDKPFQYIIEGSRKNIVSAKIKAKCCVGTQYYLGIENSDDFHGIHIAIEVVAIKKEIYLDFIN